MKSAPWRPVYTCLSYHEGIDGGTIHLWQVELDAAEECIAPLRALLSPDETARMERFYTEQLRRDFAIAHGCLRALLGRHLAVEPATIQFTYSERGKPRVKGIEFSLSHAGSLMAVAVAEGCEVGVDIEKIRPMNDLDRIAGRFFSPDEAADLRSLPESDREAAFFHCWTRKEAFVKATGEGLYAALETFRTTLRPGEEARMLYVGGDPDAAREWQMHAFAPAPGYAGALVYRGAPRNVEQFTRNPCELLQPRPGGR
ncbi:MAG TPA: 4'-phosphopantetheinyl transferase superfamily protein [Bryobacteraceae bacterium]